MTKATKLVLILLAAIMANAASANDLPNLGEHSATVFTPAQEAQLGQDFFHFISQHVPILGDALTEEYIQNLGDRLVAHTSSPNRKFHFFVVADPSINAFAGPGAYIGIHTGAILVSRNESELAAIMAHEISHVTQHHIERTYEHITGVELPTIAAVAAAAILGIATGTNAGAEAANGAVMASMAGSMQNQINFTREQEGEADHIGMRVLAVSGFDPNAMAASFQHVQRVTYDYGENSAFESLSDHPQTNERIADASAREAFFTKISPKSSKEFFLVQTRIKVMQYDNPIKAVNHFKAELKRQNNESARYGYALALDTNHEFAAAESIMQQLTKNDPTEIFYQLDLADIQQDAKKGDAAEATLKKALEQKPNYYPAVLQYASTLLTNNKPALAAEFLRSKSLHFPDRSIIYFLLAQAQAKAGDLASAYQSRAKAMELEGFNDQALLLLQQAQRLPKLSNNDKAIISARIQRLKKQTKK
jgi:beta-barrel assembly-enhancing protease